MANRKARLYQSVKRGDGSWTWRKVDPTKLKRLREGSYRVFWYVGKRRFTEDAGRDPDTAKIALARRENTMRRAALGFKVEEIQSQQRIAIKEAIAKFLRDKSVLVGKDGIGRSRKTITAYIYRLSKLQQFCDDSGERRDGTKRQPLVYLDELAHHDVLLDYLNFLREDTDDYSDRTVYNMLQAAHSFLRVYGIQTAGQVLSSLGYVNKVVEAYTAEELEGFFAACGADERLLFSFFLNSGCREGEVAHAEVQDLSFRTNVLHIQGKPHRNFRLKGKADRFVPLPQTLMAKLRTHCKGKAPSDLLFPNKQGKSQGHFLRMCQAIALRAGLNCGGCRTTYERKKVTCRTHPVCKHWGLHKFRKTFATTQHNDGVSAYTVMERLGHSDIKVTMAYLKASEAEGAHAQAQVNAGRLAAYV